MNIVQSFWSAPVSVQSGNEWNRHAGGWLSEKHHAISWAFSLGLLKRYHKKNKITLYTDSGGADWLVNRIGLEYDEVNVSFNELKRYDPLFWAIGKIYAYSQQKEPFLHVDGDVFAWRSFESFVHNRPLVVQSFEIGLKLYKNLIEDAGKCNISLPECFAGLPPDKDFTAVNAGLLGGHDLEFIQRFCRIAFDFVDANHDQILTSGQKGGFNILFEQYFFTQLALLLDGSYDRITTLVSPEEGGFSGLTRFSLVPQQNDYVHTISPSKTFVYVAHHMEQRFACEFPQLYRHILQVYKEPAAHYIFSSLPKGYEGASKNIKEKQPFAASIQQAKLIDPEPTAINEYEIEDLLAEQFDNPEYFRLWDIFQIESAMLDTNKLISHDVSAYWKYVYDYTVDEFFKVPFRMNTDICRMVYLYHNWKGGLFINDINAFARNETSLPLNANNEMQPWMVSQRFEYIDVFRPEAWISIFRFMEDGPATGEELMEAISKSDLVLIDTASLRDDLYFFLTSQLLVYYRIVPAETEPAAEKKNAGVQEEQY